MTVNRLAELISLEPVQAFIDELVPTRCKTTTYGRPCEEPAALVVEIVCRGCGYRTSAICDHHMYFLERQEVACNKCKRPKLVLLCEAESLS